MRKIILISAISFGLSACSGNVKEDLGLTSTPPDEFSVITRAPLSVPPDFSLRPPRPGAERPMEISTKAQARQTIFGASDIDQSGTARNRVQADGFLAKVGADNVDPNIRDVIDAEEPTDNRTTAERLLFMSGSEDLGDPINPEEEFERLKEEGVVTIKKRTEDPPAP